MIRLAIVLAGLFLLLAPSAAATAPEPGAMAAKAHDLIETFVRANQFSGTVLVAQDGKPVLREAFGLANREWSVANIPEAKFRLGSITKAFTATAILQLAEAGKLAIDDPVSKYYADAPAAWKDVTIRTLLTHTSGIPSYTAISHFFAGEARLDRTPEEIIKLTRDKPLEFAPGTKFAYDNTGYIILGYIVEKVSGETYADYLAGHIFKPLGMTSSGYDSSTEIIAHRAAGYDLVKGGFINTPYLSMTEPFAAGSLYSTVDDMLIWDQALYAGKPLSAASLKAMFTDQGHGYGFGWFIGKKFGRDRISHGGGINGFVTEFDRYPADRLTVIVLSNQSSAPVARIADSLAALYFDVPPRTAAVGGEAAVRRLIDELARGAPDYGRMSPLMAGEIHDQLAALKSLVNDLGPLKSVTLLGADPGGADRYRSTFAKGSLEWGIRMGKAGRLDAASVEPAP